MHEEEKQGAGDMINLIEEKINRGHTEENPVLRARSVFNGKVQDSFEIQGWIQTHDANESFGTLLVDTTTDKRKTVESRR